jgi:methyl coenzyme M reductase subunit D
MDQYTISKLLSCIVDNEPAEQDKIDELKQLIEKDEKLKYDYEVQAFIKSLVSEKLKMQPASERIKKKIIRKINPKKNLFQRIFRFLIPG